MTSENINLYRGLYTIDQKVQPYSSPFSHMQKANELLAIASNNAEAISTKLPEIYGVIADKYKDPPREKFGEVLQQTLNKNLQQSLEEKIEQLQDKDLFKDYFRNVKEIKDENGRREFIKALVSEIATTSIEVLVTIAFDGGIPYKHSDHSGDFNEAYSSLIPKFRESFGYTRLGTSIKNTAIYLALYLLVHEGYAVQGLKIEESATEQKEKGKNKTPALVITSKPDEYLEGYEQHFNKPKKEQKHSQSDNGSNGSGNRQESPNNHHSLKERVGHLIHLNHAKE